MSYKNNIKQRNKTIQGLRSFKDTLPTSIKKIIKKKGHIFSETLNNWKYIVGNKLFKICYPKSFKNSNRFGVSTLQVMVERGNEVELEYSKKQILKKMNSYFGYIVVEKLKLISFEKNLDNFTSDKSDNSILNTTTNTKFINKIVDIKNDKIKNSLIKLNKIFKGK
jgi:hypothetical protein